MAIRRWEIDSGHSGIHLSARHMMLTRVRGVFTRWSGTILADEADLARAAVDVYIDATSLDTGVADRDAHLKSPDFLHVARYPELVFRGTRLERQGEARATLTGALTLHGVTREVTLDVEFTGRCNDPWGHERAGFFARTTLDRRDYGLVWNQLLEAGGLLVGHLVDVEIDVEAVLQEGSVEVPPPADERL